jgi:hypothetical protein
VIGGEGDNQVVPPHLLHQKGEEPLQQPVGTDGDVHDLMAVRPVAVAHQIVGGEADCQQVGVFVSTQLLRPDHPIAKSTSTSFSNGEVSNPSMNLRARGAVAS